MNNENDPTLTSSHDDLAAAFKAAESATPAAPSAPAQSTEPSQGTAPTQRGSDGRFVAGGGDVGTTPTPLGTPATPTPSTTPQAPTAPTAAPVTTPPAGAGDSAPLKLDPAKPPSAWTPAMKEKWNTLPEDVRQEITRREEATAAGVQRLRQQYEPAERVMQVVAPHAQYFQHIQRHPEEYINEVINTEQMLNLGNPAQKMQTLLDLADQYGVPLRQVIDSAMGGQLNTVLQQAHQQHKTPTPLPPEILQELNTLRTQQDQIVQQAAESELRQFEATNPPFLNDVRDKMADLLEKGVVETYQDAYDLAVWQNPELRQRSVAQINGQQQQSGIQQRQALAAAVATPGSAPIQSGAHSKEDESTEDAVRRAWASATNGGM